MPGSIVEHMAATYQVTPPEPFAFSRPEEWTKWSRRFERFRQASGLKEKDEEAQVNTLIYSMGDEADDIMRSFGLAVEDAKNYSTVLAKFEAHFVKRRNVIFERAKFNMRRQEEGESVDAFITALYGLAEHCGYGNLHDEMVRDRIVVGIRNAALSEKLQLDAELTLEKAVTYVRQSETVKQQQTLLRGGNTEKPDTVIGAVQGTREPGQGSRRQRSSQWTSRGPTQNQCGSSTVCSRCGKFPAHDREHCPAKDAICRKCSKRGHYQAVCRSPAKVGGVQAHTDSSHEVFLGAVETQDREPANPWAVTLQLNVRVIEFQIDTGAEVTVISEHAWRQISCPPLSATQCRLRGPDTHTLSVNGIFTGKHRNGENEAEEEIYVVKRLHTPLLGRPAIDQLGLLARVGTVDRCHQSPKQQFPQLFEGLGKLQGDYNIELEPEAKPYVLSTPRRVAIPLRKAVEQELRRMEALGVIAKVNEPTAWCACMVVVPKANGKVRICVDLTQN